jgi:myo-inositol-1(or 4)-monophosphatase
VGKGDLETFTGELAEAAGTLAQQLRRERGNGFISQKGPMDFLTLADLSVERFIREKLDAAFPETEILGEEEGGTPTGDYWVVDPIDGTTNYLKGLPEWGVSIALIQNDRVVCGAIACPDLHLLATATHGQGATMNGTPLAARSEAVTELIQLGYSKRVDVKKHLRQLETVLENGADYRRCGAACVGLLSVAAGWCDAYYEEHLNLWDAAAGLLLIEEAGGQCSHARLNTFMTNGSPVIAVGAAEKTLLKWRSVLAA